MSSVLAHLYVRRLSNREIVHTVDLYYIDDNYVEKVMRGMLINMSPDFFVDDSEVDKVRKKSTKPKVGRTK